MAKKKDGKMGGKTQFGPSNAGAGKTRLGGKVTFEGPGSALHDIAKGGGKS